MSKGSRERILEAAREMFYCRGYLATSVDDIIARARVSKSNFYYHFKSKEELGIAVLGQRCEEFHAALGMSLCNAALSPREKLDTFFRLVAENRETASGGCPFGNLVAEMGEHSERFRSHLVETFRGLTMTLTETVAEGQKRAELRADISPADAAALMVHTLQGAMLLQKCYKARERAFASLGLLLKLMEPASETNRSGRAGLQ